MNVPIRRTIEPMPLSPVTPARPLTTATPIRPFLPGRSVQPLARPGLGALSAAAQRERLHKLSSQLEGVFMNQLFQAMRATVPHSSFTGEDGEDSGREMFDSMLDERIANTAAEHMTRGVGDAIYRELARRVPDAGSKP